jgi:hypothetical protein
VRAGAAGIAFVTNQELSGSQRLQLERSVSVAVEMRDAVSGEFGFLSTRGLPRELRIREPRQSMANAFVRCVRCSPCGLLVIDALESISYRERRVLESYALASAPSVLARSMTSRAHSP